MNKQLIDPSVSNFLQGINNFSPAGLTGVAHNASLFSPLGERLASGDEVLRRELEALLNPSVATGDMMALWLSDPQAFWQKEWDRILGPGIVTVPPLPKMKGKTRTAIARLRWRLFLLPKELSEDKFPSDWVKPAWGKYLEEKSIKRLPFAGRWLAVDVSGKPAWDDPEGYRTEGGEDTLARELDLATPIPKEAKSPRFGHSFDDLHAENGVLHRLARPLGLSRRSVRLPTAEEWNAVANLLLHFNRRYATAFPDLGSTNSWEWVENEYSSGSRLGVGFADCGGLAFVGGGFPGGRYGGGGFRVLAVL